MTTLGPGDPAPAFALSDQRGETVRLDVIREGGQRAVDVVPVELAA